MTSWLVTSLFSWLPVLVPLVATVAAGRYLAQVRSGSSVALTVGAAGWLVIGLARLAFGAFAEPQMLGPRADSTTMLLVIVGLQLIGTIFMLIFAIALLLVLRHAALVMAPGVASGRRPSSDEAGDGPPT